MFLGKFEQKSQLFLSAPPPPIAVYRAPMQNVTCTRLVSRLPSVNDRTALSKVAAVFAEFPGRLLEATVALENQHQKYLQGIKESSVVTAVKHK